MVKILSEAKNALTKQYQKQFKLDNVDLKFEQSALKAVAKRAIELDTGARGLRAILEDTLLDLMYEIPSYKSIVSVTINDAVIKKQGKPIIERNIA